MNTRLKNGLEVGGFNGCRFVRIILAGGGSDDRLALPTTTGQRQRTSDFLFPSVMLLMQC